MLLKNSTSLSPLAENKMWIIYTSNVSKLFTLLGFYFFYLSSDTETIKLYLFNLGCKIKGGTLYHTWACYAFTFVSRINLKVINKIFIIFITTWSTQWAVLWCLYVKQQQRGRCARSRLTGDRWDSPVFRNNAATCRWNTGTAHLSVGLSRDSSPLRLPT